MKEWKGLIRALCGWALLAVSLTCCAGCLTVTVCESWEGKLNPAQQTSPRVYQVGDEAFLFPVTIREHRRSDLELCETVDTVWLYVPESALEPTSDPDVSMHWMTPLSIVPPRDADRLRRDSRTRKIAGQVEVQTMRANDVAQDLQRDRRLCAYPCGDGKCIVVVMSDPSGKKKPRKLVVAGGWPLLYRPWWRWPARVALVPLAAVGDAVVVSAAVVAVTSPVWAPTLALGGLGRCGWGRTEHHSGARGRGY